MTSSTSAEPTVRPFALKDAPALMERLWPAQKISAEAQKERKAGAGQTLTALGSFWKGRKPLVLVRACVLGALLPATGDPERDLAIFEQLMAIDDKAFEHRAKMGAYPGILEKPYMERIEKDCLRPEELPDAAYESIWSEINAHLETSAHSFPELVEQLGVMRFGHRPKVADTFCGGGSIPFEAARLGCDVYASDLNPIACMLTWGALNIIGADEATRKEIEHAQREVAEAVDREIIALGIEHDEKGNRAKAYLYCLETRCPETGWMVPMAPNWVISRTRRTVAKLVPDHSNKRFEIAIESGVADAEMEAAGKGTVRDGSLVYDLDGETYSTPIKTIRGDYKNPDGSTGNRLRLWEKSDFVPRSDDVFQERLFCVQWMKKGTLSRRRPDTFFAPPNNFDIAREREVERIVQSSLSSWQEEGFTPDMPIEPGDKTDEPIRTRGWTYWHQLFCPRQIHIDSLFRKHCKRVDNPYIAGVLAFQLTSMLNWSSKLSQWRVGTPGRGGSAPGADVVNHVFYNQALNTFYVYGSRGFRALRRDVIEYSHCSIPGSFIIETFDAASGRPSADYGITDPPYADAVNYHEIYDYFVAWLRKNSPEPFRSWTWDSRRALAIKGSGEDFRRGMVEAYRTLAEHMPDNGLQIVMFTHQSGEVWADMAQIFWGSGLQVMAAWYIATETTSELKKGGYVQGTVILVLRKRLEAASGYGDEIVQEVRDEVARQIDTMVGLNQRLKGSGRIENLFEDADLQMAGYAAALRVLTGYARIDGLDLTQEAIRPRKKGETGLVGEIIEFAVQVANEHLVPEPLDPRVWERLTGSERFYLKMLDIETTGASKLDNYQNFAKAFRVTDYSPMMGSIKPNAARLRSASEFKKTEFAGSEFGMSATRAILFALYELGQEIESDVALSHLRDQVQNYYQRRDDLAAIAAFIANKREGIDGPEAEAARILHTLIRTERLG